MISWSGTINSKNGDHSVTTEYGGEITVHPPPIGDYFAITLSSQRQLSSRAPKSVRL